MSPAAISFVFHLWIFKSHYEARTNPCQPASYPSGSLLNISFAWSPYAPHSQSSFHLEVAQLLK